MTGIPAIDWAVFVNAYRRFQERFTIVSGRAFAGFDDGLMADLEGYKPRLRDHALRLLAPQTWTEAQIGTGEIVERAISAIEIDTKAVGKANNLVFWGNGPKYRELEHLVLLEAKNDRRAAGRIERLLFSLYRSEGDEEAIFDDLSALSGGKYRFLAYLFFLKDSDRFMPISPRKFDKAFADIGIGLKTVSQCRWRNYQAFNATLDQLRPLIAQAAKLPNVRLIDAHSYCYTLATLLKTEAEGKLGSAPGKTPQGKYLDLRKQRIVEMRMTIEDTVRKSNGQTVGRTVKNKELLMTSQQLEALLERLCDAQENRCALSGIPFDIRGGDGDKALKPAADRIDSDGHYEYDNLQIVCRFINQWKSDSKNQEFKRLLDLVKMPPVSIMEDDEGDEG